MAFRSQEIPPGFICTPVRRYLGGCFAQNCSSYSGREQLVSFRTDYIIRNTNAELLTNLGHLTLYTHVTQTGPCTGHHVGDRQGGYEIRGRGEARCYATMPTDCIAQGHAQYSSNHRDMP